MLWNLRLTCVLIKPFVAFIILQFVYIGRDVRFTSGRCTQHHQQDDHQ